MDNLLENPNQPFLQTLIQHFRRIAANGDADPYGLQYLIQRYMRSHGNNFSFLSELLSAYTRRDVIMKSSISTDYIQPGLAFIRPVENQNTLFWQCTEVTLTVEH